MTTKLFCGKCGSMMAGESGTSATAKVYHYYKCNNAKRHMGCDKKAVGKKWIEDIVIEEILLLLKDDTTLGKIADAVVAETQKESPAILAMNVELADTQSKLKNIMNAIENGIFAESTKSRPPKAASWRKMSAFYLSQSLTAFADAINSDIEAAVIAIGIDTAGAEGDRGDVLGDRASSKVKTAYHVDPVKGLGFAIMMKTMSMI